MYLVGPGILNRKLLGSHSGPRLYGEGKNLLILPGIESQFLGLPARSQVTIMITRSRLRVVIP
jgi:hypothetical protein